MKLRFVWLLLPLLSGCASYPTGDSPQAVCQRQALNDPNVRQITVRQMNSGTMSGKANFAYTQAVHDAYNKCLLQRGVTVRGGVEPVRPGY